MARSSHRAVGNGLAPQPTQHGDAGPDQLVPGTRIQLCGCFVARVGGVRVEDRFPGRQGRLLFAYLAATPHRGATRDELADVLWGDHPPSAPGMALSALTSKLRRVLGEDALEGRAELHLRLEKDAFVDVDQARRAVHAAESLVDSGRWWDAYPNAVIAGAITRREFLRGEDAPWVHLVRQELADICLRALECNVRICLAVGGPELPTAELLSRELTRRAPFRESGYALLMRSLAARGLVAEALRVYAELQRRLMDELGTAPAVAVRELHRQLLRETT